MTESELFLTRRTAFHAGSTLLASCATLAIVEQHGAQSAETTPLPGQGWRAVLRKIGTPEFAGAFVKDPVLKASVMNRECVGVASMAAFFDASRQMYDSIAFKRETISGAQTYLEWEGKVFGDEVGGVTILARDETGLIQQVEIFHRPLHVVARFSNELGKRLAGKLDASLFEQPK
jgi:hypothetical protein